MGFLLVRDWRLTMSSQSHFTFDPTVPEGSNITGIYSNLRLIKANLSYIPVTPIEVERYKKRPNCYRVEEGKLLEIVKEPEHVKLSELAKPRALARNSIMLPVLVDGREYTIDLPFQTNLALALCIAAHKDAVAPKFWCKENDTWVFREHSLDELINISMEINKRRETISARLYDELG